MHRRQFLRTSVTASLSSLPFYDLTAKVAGVSSLQSKEIPSYLSDYTASYKKNPRTAALEWFREAKFGLFLHYGLYSLEGRHEWLQLKEKIPVATYAKLKDRFTAENFDANLITDLAIDAGMKYINITTRHHDSFCLFETKQTDFHSVNSPAKRDLVGELAEACQKKKLGLCLYYSHGRDWKHPHAPNNDRWGGNARPKYNPREPSYVYGKEHDLNRYLDFMTAQITELLTNYGPVAAIWLDGISVPLSRKGKKRQAPAQSGNAPEFHCQKLYNHIHSLQPQVLVSYKQGVLGSEDFFAPEHKAIPSKAAKPMEICSSLQKGSWGFHKNRPRLNAAQAWAKYLSARKSGANLLLNTGPLPDGSIHPTDAKNLRYIGKQLRPEDE